MIDVAFKAYVTRHLFGAALASALAGSLWAFTAVSDARTPSIEARLPGRAGSPAVPSAAIEGLASVSDGDTIIVAGVRVRLEGIDAPEAGQQCRTRFGQVWPCGAKATALLVRMIEARTVVCADHGTDKYGRMLGVCYLNGVDINAEMVRRGFAWAFVKYSRAYMAEETEAKMARLGVWDGEATPPWEHRAGRWQVAEPLSPSGCAIKGNVTAQGRIYHMPWSPWYEKVKMDTEKGKRWFCSEAEALSAGWRPAQLH